jgi:predicted phosphodiesterase
MAANFGELVLLVGDHHIPMRAHSIPAPFRRMLVPGKMQHVVCTGNLGCVEEYNRLRKLVGGSAANVHCVAGEYDFASSYPSYGAIGVGGGGDGGIEGEGAGGGEGEYASLPSFPETKVINLGEFRVGVIGGHQVVPWGDLSALAMVRRRLDVDVLVCGRRRKEGIVEYEGATMWRRTNIGVLGRSKSTIYVSIFRSSFVTPSSRLFFPKLTTPLFKEDTIFSR